MSYWQSFTMADCEEKFFVIAPPAILNLMENFMIKFLIFSFLSAFFSITSYANENLIVQCLSKEDARVVQIDLNNLVATIIDNNESIVLNHIAPDTDGIIEFDNGYLNILFSYLQGSSKGIGQASLSDSTTNVSMWCKTIE